jgi:hypothetical protein
MRPPCDYYQRTRLGSSMDIRAAIITAFVGAKETGAA